MDQSPIVRGALPLTPDSRRSFLSRSAMTFAGSAALLMAFSKGTDAYAADKGGDDSLSANEKGYFTSIRKHENDHVAFLVQALGANARPKPTFQNLGQRFKKNFIQLSQALENTGVGAYLGAAPYIDNPDFLAAAGSIVTVEARHAGYLNVLAGDPITGNAMEEHVDHSFDEPLTADEVAAAAGGFVASLNGGPALTYSTTPSPTNDIAILNFALALEYLEAEFYNINVPKFFSKKNS